jgi:ComF family protein
MKLFHLILHFLFPPKCVLCRNVLLDEETDLCKSCRRETEIFPKPKTKHPFLASWTALWYYNGNVRRSLIRFKFYNARSNAVTYGRLLAMKLLEEYPEGFDLLTWIPISPLRRIRRGYDQVELIANAVSAELGLAAMPTLKKIRHNRPQSRITEYSRRRANVLGAYEILPDADITGKRVLLLDDILTTGATASEAGRILLTAGAKEVTAAAVAASTHNSNKHSR